MDEDTARKYYVMLQTMHQQRSRLDQHLQEIDEKTLELQRMRAAITELEGLPADTEQLVPLTSGVFYKTTKHDVSKLYLNVGAGVVVSRTPSEARDILEKQENELAAFRKQIQEQRAKTDTEIEALEERIASEVEGV